MHFFPSNSGGGNDGKKGVENSPAVVKDHVKKVKIGSAKKKPKMENGGTTEKEDKMVN